MAEKCCSKCGAVKPLDAFYRHAAHADGRDSQCVQCHLGSKRRNYADHWERRRNYQRDWTFGLQPGEYDRMLTEQSGVCAVCGQPETMKWRERVRALAVDHDRRCCPGNRSCGKCVRGLLCGNCNRSIGLLGEDPDRIDCLAAYVRAGY